jgi:hypothetical protein
MCGLTCNSYAKFLIINKGILDKFHIRHAGPSFFFTSLEMPKKEIPLENYDHYFLCENQALNFEDLTIF